MSKQDMLKIQTCVLKVQIHCDGCKQKVKKKLQKIEGVYKVNIDGDQGKVTVSGNVDPATLIKKLEKSGKHAELWGGGGQKGAPNLLNNQFKNIQLDNFKGKDTKSQKGGKDQQQQKFAQQMAFQQMQQHGKGPKDIKFPGKDQKNVKFDLPEEDDFDDDDEDDFDDEFDEDDLDEFDDEFDEGMDDHHHHKQPPKINIPVMGGKGVKGFDLSGGKGLKGFDPSAGGGGGGKGFKGGFDPMMNGHGNLKGNDDFGDGAKGKKSGGFNSFLKGVLGSNDGKSGKGEKHGKGEKNGKGGNEIQVGGKNGGKNKNGNGGNAKGGANGNGFGGKKNSDNWGKKGGENFEGGFKMDLKQQGLHEIDAARKGAGGKNIGPMGQMGGNMHPAMGGQMGGFPAAQGMAGPMGFGQHPMPGMGQGNPYMNQQYLAQMMMNQQQRGNGQDMYHHPMMYARPQPPMGYGPPHPANDQYTHMFNDENTESCSIM